MINYPQFKKWKFCKNDQDNERTYMSMKSRRQLVICFVPKLSTSKSLCTGKER